MGEAYQSSNWPKDSKNQSPCASVSQLQRIRATTITTRINLPIYLIILECLSKTCVQNCCPESTVYNVATGKGHQIKTDFFNQKETGLNYFIDIWLY